MQPLPSNINITFEWHEVEPDGSGCSTCGALIIGSMFKLYVSVNTTDVLDFEMLPSKYQVCETCKIKADSK